MSFSVNSDYEDDFFDAETFLARIGGHHHDCSTGMAARMDSVPLETGKGISFNPMVEARGINGSLSQIPIAAHDGYHNCRQYYNEPYPSSSSAIGGGDGDSSAASMSLEEAFSEESSASGSSGNLGAPRQRRNGGPTDRAVGAAAVADNVMQGPVLLTGMTNAVHYLTSLFEDENSESEALRACDEDERGEELQRETSRRDESRREKQTSNNCSKNGGRQAHQSVAEKARAAK